MTLYSELLQKEKIKDRIISDFKNCEDILKKYSDIPEFKMPSFEVPPIDTFQMQRDILRDYENNPV